MVKLNAEWHRGNPMPKNASLDQRVKWHLAHARACGCRDIPGTVKAELRRRGLAAPSKKRRSGRRAPGGNRHVAR